ncbi:MAG: DNA-binding response regulator [Nonomuraea muscovyensis]|nr:DNA-binding response regulator [Nonomuraea muscovyensis]
MTIRGLVADDQQLVRVGCQMILDAQPDMEVVAAVSDGAEAVAEARRLRPDVCLLDIRMPKLDGIEVTRILAGPGWRTRCGWSLSPRSILTSTSTEPCAPAPPGSCSRTFVSLPTVKTHLGSIFATLGVRNRVGIAAWAWESGVVS